MSFCDSRCLISSSMNLTWVIMALAEDAGSSWFLGWAVGGWEPNPFVRAKASVLSKRGFWSMLSAVFSCAGLSLNCIFLLVHTSVGRGFGMTPTLSPGVGPAQ